MILLKRDTEHESRDRLRKSQIVVILPVVETKEHPCASPLPRKAASFQLCNDIRNAGRWTGDVLKVHFRRSRPQRHASRRAVIADTSTRVGP